MTYENPTPPPIDLYAARPDTGPRTNVLAIIALVLGITVPVAGIIAGHIALSQIKCTHEEGHGMALAGTIIGYVLTGLAVLAFVAYIIFFVVLIAGVSLHGSPTTGYSF